MKKIIDFLKNLFKTEKNPVVEEKCKCGEFCTCGNCPRCSAHPEPVKINHVEETEIKISPDQELIIKKAEIVEGTPKKEKSKRGKNSNSKKEKSFKEKKKPGRKKKNKEDNA